MMDRHFRRARGLSNVKKRVSLASMALLIGLASASAPRLLAQNTAQNAVKTHRKVLVMIEPEYPYVLRNGHFEGQIRLEATVLPNGNVSKVECKSGNPMLAQYASQAVMRWKYAPGPAQTLEEAVFVFNPNK
jgi:TonB family protein